jgi:hypothetical protein
MRFKGPNIFQVKYSLACWRDLVEHYKKVSLHLFHTIYGHLKGYKLPRLSQTLRPHLRNPMMFNCRVPYSVGNLFSRATM